MKNRYREIDKRKSKQGKNQVEGANYNYLRATEKNLKPPHRRLVGRLPYSMIKYHQNMRGIRKSV